MHVRAADGEDCVLPLDGLEVMRLVDTIVSKFNNFCMELMMCF